MKRKYGIGILFFMACLLLVINALTSYISVSEFWPITLAREVLHLPTEEISLYYKPTFHLLLALPHLFHLSNVEHILFARGIFGLLACGIVYFFYQISKRSGEKSQFAFALIATILLASSPLFFSQVVKIRSDILSLFLSLAFISTAISQKPPWSNRRTIALLLLQYLLLGSTPRALFHEIISMSFVLAYHWKNLKESNSLKRTLIFLLFPFLAIFISAIFNWNVVVNLANYFSESFLQSRSDWGHLRLFLHQEFILPALILISLIWTLIQRQKSSFQIATLTSFLLAFLSYAVADLKTPYLLASLLPFFIFPILGPLAKIPRVGRWGVCVLVLAGNFFWINPHEWWSSNSLEIDIIHDLSEFLNRNPNLTYMDGIGILPRTPQKLSYIGPEDEVSNQSFISKFTESKPDVVLYNSRTPLLGQEFTDNLLKNYRQVATNLFVKKEISVEAPKDFPAPPVLVFNLEPLINR